MDEKYKVIAYPNIDFDLEELGTINDSPIDAVADMLRDASSI